MPVSRKYRWKNDETKETPVTEEKTEKSPDKPLFRHLGLVEVRALRDAVNEGLTLSEKGPEVVANVDMVHAYIVVDTIVERRVREALAQQRVGVVTVPSEDRRPH